MLSAGASGSLILLQLSPVLQGDATFAFEPESGVPAVTAGLNANLNYAALAGRVEAFAEYPVIYPWPPFWDVKRASLEVFSWKGFTGAYHIMGWGMKVTPFASQLTGDLVDQTDREEAQALTQASSAQERKIAFAKLQQEAQQREHQVVSDMLADLNADDHRNLPREAARFAVLNQQVDLMRDDYLATLKEWLQGETQR